jgi:hypothetical protein
LVLSENYLVINIFRPLPNFKRQRGWRGGGKDDAAARGGKRVSLNKNF